MATSPGAPPTYRERLRLEGTVLAAVGAAEAGALLALAPQARRRPWSTVAQLGLTATLAATRGRTKVQRALDEAVELTPGAEGGGEPTPLWMLPAIAAALTAFVAAPLSPRSGWDAGLRVAGGCVIAGVAQAALYERAVAAAEAANGRRYIRVAGSGLLGGTNLGWVPAGASPAR